MYNNYSPLEFVKNLSFVRYGGTPAEKQAAEYIKAEVEKKIITKQLAVNGKIIDVIPLKAPIKRRYIAERSSVGWSSRVGEWTT